MKNLKVLLFPVLIMILISSCKKTSNDQVFNEQKIESGFSIKNGITTFPNSASYLKFTENKNGEQQNLFKKLKSENFSSLREKTLIANPTSFVAGIINQFTDAFDSTLYTEYMLSILNKDKICSINGYWVKVDMDNNFCSALDQTLYPNETEDLRNNNFNNPHVLVFVHQDEPVLYVLDGLKNNDFTWAQYQDEVAARKGGGGGGGGICLEKGHSEAYNATSASYPGGTLVARVRYIRNFLHFALKVEGWGNGNNAATNVRVYGHYSYKGQCKGSYSASFNYPATTWYWNVDLYSGGSPLNSFTLVSSTYSPQYGITAGPAQIN
jgi:hypothetical protein